MRKSDIIKLELMKYFRFEKGMVFVCSECIHQSDINAINEKCLVEVEVKISKSDFRREFATPTLKNGTYWKAKKHEFYANPENAYSSYIIPNKFYFCVPEELEQWAMEYLKGKNQKYGLLIYDEKITGKTSNIRLAKGARQLQTNPPDNFTWKQMGQRVTNEMITLKQKFNRLKQEVEAQEEFIKKQKITA